MYVHFTKISFKNFYYLGMFYVGFYNTRLKNTGCALPNSV